VELSFWREHRRPADRRIPRHTWNAGWQFHNQVPAFDLAVAIRKIRASRWGDQDIHVQGVCGCVRQSEVKAGVYEKLFRTDEKLKLGDDAGSLSSRASSPTMSWFRSTRRSMKPARARASRRILSGALRGSPFTSRRSTITNQREAFRIEYRRWHRQAVAAARPDRPSALSHEAAQASFKAYMQQSRLFPIGRDIAAMIERALFQGAYVEIPSHRTASDTAEPELVEDRRASRGQEGVPREISYRPISRSQS